MTRDILHRSTVLVLNRNWQAIHVKTSAEAFCMMAAGSATGLDVQGDEQILPVNWQSWLKLPVRDDDNRVNTPRGPVRVPTVIVAANYAKVPLCRPRFGVRGIWERDGGVCQYTGRKLAPGEGNIDHVVPRSRGGDSSWENCVLSHREVNSRKGDRLPQEAGLRLLKHPAVPRALPATAFIRNHHGIRDWHCGKEYLPSWGSAFPGGGLLGGKISGGETPPERPVARCASHARDRGDIELLEWIWPCASPLRRAWSAA